MALVDVEGVFYATILVGGTRQATAATKWVPIPACSGIGLGLYRVKPYLETFRVLAPVRSRYTFVARYNGHVWYFRYCGAGKSLPRVANHVRGCWVLGGVAKGVLPSHSR